MAFVISPTPTRAYRRLKPGEAVCETFADLVALQDRIMCDLYITQPDEYNQRRVFLYDP